MSALAELAVPLVPGLVLLTAVALFARGLLLMRSDAVEGLDVRDLALLRREQRKAATGGRLGKLADRLVPSLREALGPAALRWLQKQVDQAGRAEGASVDTALRQIVLWLLRLSPVILIFLLSLNLIGLVACFGVAVVLPLARLSRARRLRQDQLDRDLPDFLDILSVTVSAGVGFRAALARVAERYRGPLAEEMTLTLDQIANGASRRAAFTALRDRNDSEALAQFVTAFLQAEELGAPLVDTLNQIAVDMRRTAAQRQRRKAARAVPRVTLVTSLVLVPGALILIVVGMYLGAGIDLGSMLGG